MDISPSPPQPDILFVICLHFCLHYLYNHRERDLPVRFRWKICHINDNCRFPAGMPSSFRHEPPCNREAGILLKKLDKFNKMSVFDGDPCFFVEGELEEGPPSTFEGSLKRQFQMSSLKQGSAGIIRAFSQAVNSLTFTGIKVHGCQTLSLFYMIFLPHFR